MRIALITDIHGNAIALKAALRAIANQSVERIFCLGDIAADGSQPNECIHILQDANIPALQGNTDSLLVNPHNESFLDERRQRFHEINLWSAVQLGTEERAYLATLPPVIEFPEADALFYHGSPQHNEDLILPDTNENQLEKYFAGYSARFCAGGHTHTPMLRTWGARMILTVGSVGLASLRLSNGETKPLPVAEYALIEFVEAAINTQFCQIPFDVPAFQQSLLDAGVPHAAWLISRWG